MRLDDAIAGLTSNPAPLRAAGAAARGWATSDAAAPLLAELDAYGAGENLDGCRRLAALLSDPDAALAFSAQAVDAAVAAIAAQPLALWPWRHFSNGVMHSVTLAATGRASLSLALLDGVAWSAARDPAAPDLAAFQPGELHLVVLAGGAQARILRNRSIEPMRAAIDCEARTLAKGSVLGLEGASEALALDAIDGLLLTLRLHRHPGEPAIARQYDCATGRLIHQAAGTRGESRAEMAMALLRAMGRADAAPAIAARARTGAPEARWQALRECLALDSAVGFAALLETAGRADDDLAEPARGLVAELSRRHPAFAAMHESAPRPA